MVVAIIQARMGSTRLPGKIMKDIEGEPMLWRVIERVKAAKNIQDIIIATTENEADRQVIEFAQKRGVNVFAGSESDVLDRYLQAARFFGNPEVVVRITSDCPLIDPEILDRTIEFFLKNDFDYASTGRIQSTFPDGLDTEVFKFSALERAWQEAKLPSEREHVTPYIWKNPRLFKTGELKNEKDLSHLRWTVDEERDLDFVRTVFKNLYHSDRIFHFQDVLDFLKNNPELAAKNRDIIRDAGYFKSLKEDQKQQ